MLAGPYTAFLACWILLFFHTYAATLTPLRPFRLNINWLMSGLGMAYFDPRSKLIVGPLPWARLSLMALLTSSLIVVAAYITKRRDF